MGIIDYFKIKASLSGPGTTSMGIFLPGFLGLLAQGYLGRISCLPA